MNTDKSFSDLYLACENGDIEQVKKICCQSDIEFVSLNRVESNGSTALHIASSLGHQEIVRFLLADIGVIRDRLNTEGLTAYQVAKDDAVCRSFYRSLPDQLERYSQSFQDVRDLQVSRLSSEDVDSNSDLDEDKSDVISIDSYNASNNHTSRHTDTLQILGEQTHQAIKLQYLPKTRLRTTFMYIGNLGHRLKGTYPLEHANDEILRDEFQTIVDRFITPQHSQYRKACYLVDLYFAAKQIDPLLRLYTMSTPFFSNTEKKKNPLEFAILCHLKSLQARYFQGVVYRGIVATQECLQMYKWALRHESCVITNRKFCSTSVDRNVAYMYMNDQKDIDQVNVLLILEFSEMSEMAIRLSAIPELQLRCLSEFEDEEEILVLPNAMFRVVAIEKNDFISHAYTIRLENIPIKPFSRRHIFKVGTSEILKIIRKRFQNYRNKTKESE